MVSTSQFTWTPSSRTKQAHSRGDGWSLTADLHARLIAAEHAEAQSFAVASLASRAMNRRRKEKPKLQGDIQTLNSLVQLALPLAMEGGAA